MNDAMTYASVANASNPRNTTALATAKNSTKEASAAAHAVQSRGSRKPYLVVAPGLPDGLDQLPPREVLYTVILITVKGAELCCKT